MHLEKKNQQNIDIKEKPRGMNFNYSERYTDRKLDRSLQCCFGVRGWPFVPAKEVRVYVCIIRCNSV